MASGQDYGDSMLYEIFIRRAHKCERGTRNGADVSFMTNLIDAEKGNQIIKYVGSVDKQVVQIRQHLRKAIDRFLENNLTAEEKENLLSIKSQIAIASSSRHFLEIVNNGLDTTQRFR